MKTFTGKTLALGMARRRGSKLTLDHQPANEIGAAMLAELEKFVAAFGVQFAQVTTSGKNDLRALAIMQAEVSGTSTPNAATNFSSSAKHGRADFIGRLVIERQFDHGLRAIPNAAFCR